ncbi:hypothetical protein C6P46_002414 [Rhodotorula mucilaginosa]|uniref:chitin deacetylase n=1 Tax=Rhodotorula mucilaginosa TaxID=5537 RepID=A0A9P6W4A0_RHOMI|nr:hypothetical protein C6P46_002414 [Rhodotorula mucilaginosa]TKA53752.1 hypothetical protein B0A53_03794 [Rhodotorula sp. CCFEE 5036]
MKTTASTLAAVLATAAVVAVDACGTESEFAVVRRDAIQRRQAAAAARPTDEAGMAQLTDSAQECAMYSYPPVAALLAQKVYPPIWQIANLSTAQNEATSLFSTLNGTIPNIAPRGTPTGNFTGVNYNGVEDPDCWWTWKQCHTPKLPGLQEDIYNLPEANTWGFTLDDGPNCTHNALYNFMNEQKQKATLFYIGSNVIDWPLQAQRGLADGHEICAHTWSHRYMTSLTNEQVFAELYYSKKAIKDVMGVTVQCWRPPYGDVDDRVRYIAQALGLRTIIWSDNTFDYEVSTLGINAVNANYQTIINGGKNGTYNSNGTIVLTHELNNDTMSLVQQNFAAIKAAFKYVVPVHVALNSTEPYVETGYTYPNFAQWTAGTTSITLASPTAVSSDVSLSIPLSTGATGSISASVAHSTASAGQAAAAETSGSGSHSGADSVRPLASGPVGAVLAALLGAVGAGAMAVML